MTATVTGPDLAICWTASLKPLSLRAGHRCLLVVAKQCLAMACLHKGLQMTAVIIIIYPFASFLVLHTIVGKCILGPVSFNNVAKMGARNQPVVYGLRHCIMCTKSGSKEQAGIQGKWNFEKLSKRTEFAHQATGVQPGIGNTYPNAIHMTVTFLIFTPTRAF